MTLIVQLCTLAIYMLFNCTIKTYLRFDKHTTIFVLSIYSFFFAFAFLSFNRCVTGILDAWYTCVGWWRRTFEVLFSTGSPGSTSAVGAVGVNGASLTGPPGFGICIFVYNLAPSTDENILWQLFGPFGAVTSVKVG